MKTAGMTTKLCLKSMTSIWEHNPFSFHRINLKAVCIRINWENNNLLEDHHNITKFQLTTSITNYLSNTHKKIMKGSIEVQAEMEESMFLDCKDHNQLAMQ